MNSIQKYLTIGALIALCGTPKRDPFFPERPEGRFRSSRSRYWQLMQHQKYSRFHWLLVDTVKTIYSCASLKNLFFFYFIYAFIYIMVLNNNCDITSKNALKYKYFPQNHDRSMSNQGLDRKKYIIKFILYINNKYLSKPIKRNNDEICYH